MERANYKGRYNLREQPGDGLKLRLPRPSCKRVTRQQQSRDQTTAFVDALSRLAGGSSRRMSADNPCIAPVRAPLDSRA